MTTQAAIEPGTTAVIGGVDTHKNTLYSAAVDDRGRLLGHHESPANDRGYVYLLTWIQSHGEVAAVGVESNGSFGAPLTRFLTGHAVRVVEVNRPHRLARHMHGQPDRLEPSRSLEAVLGQTSTATPKTKSGTVEVIRNIARDSFQRGQGVHERLQHAVWRYDRSTLAAARQARGVEQEDAGQPVPAAATGV